MNHQAALGRVLLSLTLILALGQGCGGPLPISDGFFSAIVRTDGLIQTNFSTDGLNWGTPFVHTAMGTVDKGVGIAADKAGLMMFLTFFTKDTVGENIGQNKLIVIAGLGNSWESISPTQLNVGAASAPAICRVDDKFFFIVWNNGNGGMSTSLFDKDKMGDNNAFRLTGEISDSLAAQIEGTPSVAALNNEIVIVWRTDNGYASHILTLDAPNANVRFGSSSELTAFPRHGTLTGPPQVTNDGTNFVLSIGTIDSAGEDMTGDSFSYFRSINGITWVSGDCQSGVLVDLHSRPHSIAIDGNGRVAQLVAGSNDGRAEIMRNCGDRKTWREESAFNDRGTLALQPAIVFRKGNQ
jgi:hypothetical protein